MTWETMGAWVLMLSIVWVGMALVERAIDKVRRGKR